VPAKTTTRPKRTPAAGGDVAGAAGGDGVAAAAAGGDGGTAVRTGAPLRRLIIVESPKKAQMISGFLGPNYVVESSFGHVRDLPSGAAEVPAKYKGQPWARLGVDVDNGFEPLYIVPADKKSQMKKLKDLLRDADELYLATDEDREGEAIAWHLLDELKPRVPVRRMVFHEITPEAIRRSVDSPRDIDQQLVDAQETRRILDRLYGYEVSPVLWKKVMPKLSAGRVQSVATRLVVQRERERIAFRTASYWDLQATLDAGEGRDPRTFIARLAAVDGARVASGRDFTALGALTSDAVAHLDEATARSLAAGLAEASFTVRSVESRPYSRKPYAPFRTTTLQQEAARKLGFSVDRTMSVAQRLYENGLITYMRTDSTTLSETAVSAARAQVRELYGDAYVPDKPRTYANKVKNAQEAHEAIRPAGDSFRTPGQTRLTGDEFRLYELVWMRTVASQMRDAEGRTVSIRIDSTSAGTVGAPDRACEFATSGRIITFPGFLRAYVEGRDDDSEADDSERRLPDVTEGDVVRAQSLAPEGHETRPPARFTEATLVRELEEREIGRPSTYASIIKTIVNRGYVFKKGSALVPTWLAFAVIRLMEEHFGKLVDYAFTAQMEDQLDEVAGGRAQMAGILAQFYFGADDLEGLQRLVTELGDIDARGINTFDLGEGVHVRVGRYGPYVEDDQGGRASVEEDMTPEDLTLAAARELLARPSGDRALGVHPDSGLPVVAKAGRYGPYVTEVLPEDAPKAAKPRTASLFSSMDPAEVTLDDAVRLLTLPRSLGEDPEADGEEITALNGRYGPYVKRGTDSRSLQSEEELFTVTLEQAQELFRQPRPRGRARAAAAPPLAELGADPNSNRPMVVKSGRFGPYVTDGETNATLRSGDDAETLTAERAIELLADKRARGPAPARKAPPRKAAPRKTPAKVTAKATTAEKDKAANKVSAKKVTAKKTSAAAQVPVGS